MVDDDEENFNEEIIKRVFGNKQRFLLFKQQNTYFHNFFSSIRIFKKLKRCY